MDPNQAEMILKGLTELLFIFLGLLTILSGILVYQNARSNRWLKSIDRSLKLLPGVSRELKRVA